MTAPTHVAFSILILNIFFSLINIKISITIYIVNIIASIIPDADYSGSIVCRIFPPFKKLQRLVGHRGLTHSFFFLVPLTVLIYFFTNIYVVIAFFLGYSSHLFGDTFTKSGVRLFYPIHYIFVFPKDGEKRFNSGDIKVESLLIVAFVFITFLYQLNIKNDFLLFFRNVVGSKELLINLFKEEKNLIKIKGEILAGKNKETSLLNGYLVFIDNKNLIVYDDDLLKYQQYNLIDYEIEKTELNFVTIETNINYNGNYLFVLDNNDFKTKENFLIEKETINFNLEKIRNEREELKSRINFPLVLKEKTKKLELEYEKLNKIYSTSFSVDLYNMLLNIQSEIVKNKKQIEKIENQDNKKLEIKLRENFLNEKKLIEKKIIYYKN